jgi:hypothetical protein
MRSVRCDVCGTKALIAASQCPKCSHLFEVRDGFGELLPLAFCPACDSYYPASVGSCKWCGTKPEPAPKAPIVWKRVGIGALVAMAWLAWLLRDPKPKPSGADRTPVPTKPALAEVSDSSAPVMRIDTAVSRVTTASAGNVAPAVTPDVPTVSPPDVVPQAATRLEVDAAPMVKPERKPAAVPPPRTRASSTRWVNSVARSWVVVRADARRSARIVASIGPDSRVQLGESRDGWRRIRSRGITGWVDATRASFSTVRGRPENLGTR